ncbi:MAG: GatB/YqeY domain-containing protein [Firmicutes bacterium]|nr:GatB/YqeY domain-containing protein [Bacillota bacterium]MDY3658628.1 GatB/YqeY domain-containing protein [Eubacteriales bacterium]
MILDEIKKANIQALKDKDTNARTIYGIVSNKAMLETIKKREKGEELCDADLVQIIQKTIKELTEEAENYKKVGNCVEESNILRQREILEKYLPKMMSNDEIKQIISSLDDKSIGNVMKYFKTNYAGKCDMKAVSEIAKQF